MTNKLLTIMIGTLVVFSMDLYGRPYKARCRYEDDPPCERGNFLVQADVLCWKARQQGLDLLSDNTKITARTTIFSATDRVQTNDSKRLFHKADFDWKCGFRLGAGYDFKNCNWELASLWTRLHSHANINKGHLRGHWTQSYNVLDTTITGPKFCLGTSFDWRAFGGVRGAIIVQNMRILSESFRTSSNPSSEPILTLNDTQFDNRNRLQFRGLGPEIGLKTHWTLGKGFKVYADADGALLYSHTDLKSADHMNDDTTSLFTDAPTTIDQFISTEKAKGNTNICQVVIDFAFGLSWQRYECLCNHKVNCLFKLGWDHSQWFDFAGGVSDLTFDGLTFSGLLQF